MNKTGVKNEKCMYLNTFVHKHMKIYSLKFSLISYCRLFYNMKRQHTQNVLTIKDVVGKRK